MENSELSVWGQLPHGEEPKNVEPIRERHAMQSIFVLDTNVLLHDPKAIFQFGDDDIVVPVYVIEELDKFKTRNDELGRNARQSLRYIDQLGQNAKIQDGLSLHGKGKLFVSFLEDAAYQNTFSDMDAVDNKILTVGLFLRDTQYRKVVFVSQDVNFRIRARCIGMDAIDYAPQTVEMDELYSGFQELIVSTEIIDRLFDSDPCTLDELRLHILDDQEKWAVTRFYPNQFLLLKDAVQSSHSAIARIQPDGNTVVPSKKRHESVWGLKPRNKEQSIALDLLLDDRIKLVTLVGKAGTGKTLLALAAGLQKVVEDSVYQKVMVSRPILPMGRDIGFLPGTLEEKLTPWMQPISDNAEFLMGLDHNDKKEGRSYQELIHLGMLHIEPLTYIRGRSVANHFMIIDEAQNLTPHEIKTILTRVGEGTKIVLTGDPYQIDHPHLDASDNGLVHAVNRFTDQGIAGHVTLSKGERSPLAEIAANIL